MIDGKINTLVLILTIKEYNEVTLENCCQEILNVLKTKK